MGAQYSFDDLRRKVIDIENHSLPFSVENNEF